MHEAPQRVALSTREPAEGGTGAFRPACRNDPASHAAGARDCTHFPPACPVHSSVLAMALNQSTGNGARRLGRPPNFLPPDFEPVLPAQWGAERGHNAALQPEKRLMLAVLSDAIELVLRDGGAVNARKAILIRRAAEWISSNDRGWAFSFVNICEALGVEPERLRKGIARFVTH